MVHRQVHLNRLPCCMPGTGASGGTAACFRVWEVGRLPYPFLTGLRPPEPGPPRRTAGGGGGPAVLGRYSSDIPSRQSGYRLLATCQVPSTLWSSTKSLGGSRKKKAASLTVYFFQSKLSWSWPCRHRAPAVASSCPSRSVRRTPALQPQSACIICLHHATPRHADAQGLAPSAGATRLRRSAPRRGLGIFGTWPCARVVGLLNVSGGKAPRRGTFAQRPWSWSGRGLKSPSHES